MSHQRRAFDKRPSECRFAFTLIELLVVVAIIAVLAGLLLSSLVGAKESANSAVCKSNLRQIQIAASVYVGDYDAFPVYSAFDPSQYLVRRYWHDLLQPYTSQMWTNKLYRCPSYRDITDYGTSVIVPCGSYSYNAYGVKRRGFPTRTPIGLGLGAYLPTLTAADTRETIDPTKNIFNPYPIRESRVRVPADMIAFGDSSLLEGVAQKLGFGGVAGYDYFFVTEKRIATDMAGVLTDRARHRKRVNVSFVDGHIETPVRSSLFEATEHARRRWNNDNEPHPEYWIYGSP